MTRKSVLAVCLLLLPLTAAAQPEVWSDAPETVVVTASARGPAIWTLSRGGAQVLVLGTIGPMPGNLEWNRDSLKPVVAGARQVLLPPAPDVNMIDAAWFYLWHGGLLHQPPGRTLEAALPEPLRARFAAARGLAGTNAERYADDIPLVAAMRLQRDFLSSRDLARDEPRRTVERLARRAGVRTLRMGEFELMPTVRAVLALPHDRQLPCLEQAVDDTERQARDAAAAADAWAIGDIAQVKAHYAEMRLLECVARASQQAGAVEALSVDLMVKGLDAALQIPGKSVAVISIGPLLRKDGVLDRLRAMGVTIEGPPG